MTSGELRLLILVLGLLFIAAVYLWERHKRTRSEIRKKREFAQAFDDPDTLSEQINELDELVTSREKNIPYIQAANPDFQLDETDGEPEIMPDAVVAETVEKEPVAQARPQSKDAILIISVASNKKFFSGDAIMSAMRALDLVPGPMDVFYRYDDSQQHILFTVASMVEPGTFPISDMSRFTTSGLTLFGRLPAVKNGSEIFDDMHESAEQLAAQLDGRLLDSQHQPLNDQALSDMRQLAQTFFAQTA